MDSSWEITGTPVRNKSTDEFNGVTFHHVLNFLREIRLARLPLRTPDVRRSMQFVTDENVHNFVSHTERHFDAYCVITEACFGFTCLSCVVANVFSAVFLAGFTFLQQSHRCHSPQTTSSSNFRTKRFRFISYKFRGTYICPFYMVS